MSSHMSSLEKLALEDQEVRQGEERRLQLFARKSTLKDPNDALAEGLDLVVNSQICENKPNVLGESAFAAPFRKHYEERLAGPDIDDLDTVSQILNLQWREFQQSLEEERQEKDEQKRARISNGIHRLWKRKDSNEVSTLSIGTAQERPVAYEDIEKSVKDAQEHWRSKSRLGGGKPQKYFHGFCSSLDAHSNLLKLLPEQSQYFSIFCGVTHTLIQASVNHQNVAKHLDEALAEISSLIKHCHERVELMDTREMRGFIKCLYSEVFRFLGSAIKWYKSGAMRKILNSLNQDQADEMKEYVDKIRSVCDKIRDKSQLGEHAEVKDFHLRYQHNEEHKEERNRRFQAEQHEKMQEIETRLMKVQIHLDADRAAKQAKLDREQKRQQMYHGQIPRATLEDMGNCAWRLLISSQQVWLNEEDKPNSSVPPILGLTTRRLTEDVEPRARMKRSSKSKGATVKREDLQLWSRDMEDFTTNVLEFLETIDLDIAVAEKEVLEVIQDWIQSGNSRAVWVGGKSQESYPSNMTTIAARVVSVLIDRGIPILCYFSSSEDDDRDACLRTRIDPGNTSGENILIDLIYSFIRQMISQLLPETRMPRKLSRDQFEGFDGSIETFESALKLFKQLFQHAPANIYIIVDGIERLDDDPACEPLLEELLMFLQDMRTNTGSHRVVKLLCTTAGQCESLETLNDDFLEFVKPRAREAKHRRRGMKRLRDFDPESDWDSSDSLMEVCDSE